MRRLESMGDRIFTLAAIVLGVVIPIAFVLLVWFSL